MRLYQIAAAVIAATACGGMVGCQNRTPAPSGPADATPPGASRSPAGIPPTSRAAKGPRMGTPQQAGPFTVTLSSDPGLRAPGNVTFTATVSRDGAPVPNAKVKVGLSMIEHGGPSVVLRPQAGRYEGMAPLSMAGDWDVKVTVSAGGSTGTARYVLWANP